ncbi:MAG: Ig domain-containing protein [Flavobacteriales bacterium]
MITLKKLVTGLLPMLVFFTACKKDDDKKDDSDKGSENYVLVIDNGPITLEPDESTSYSAHLIDKSGNIKTASGVKWSTSNSAVATISTSGGVSVVSSGVVYVKATVEIDGSTLTAEAPLQIRMPSLFSVVPGGIVFYAGESIQLEKVFFNAGGTPSYTYSSDDASVASVNNTGLVSLLKEGSTLIHVKATVNGNESEVIVPILVMGEIKISLPVTKVKVTPSSSDLFKGDQVTLSAKAYDMNDAEVSTPFSWSSADDAIATVDANGVVTAKGIGSVNISATAKGVSGMAEILVSPDTIVIVDPMMISIAAGGSKTFTAKAYNAKTMTQINSITQFNWMIPSYGISMFDIGSVDANGKVTIKGDAMPGMSSVVIATVPGASEYVGGAALVSVAIGGGADCGSGNPDVATITIAQGSSANLSITGTSQITLTATAKDANNNIVANPALKFHSDNLQAASVDENTGVVTATGPGTAVITVCSGGYASKQITINVSF